MAVLGTASAQKYALLDKAMYSKIRYSDSLTKDDINSGFFPILKTDIDSILPTIKHLQNLNKLGISRKLLANTTEFSQTIKIEIVSTPLAYGDRYDIDIISTTASGTFSYRISSSVLKNTDNQVRIKNLYNYLTKGKLVKLN